MKIEFMSAKKFLMKFLDYWPYKSFICGCGVANDRDGEYFKVNILSKLPKAIVLPSHFMGVRVISEVVGKIKKLKK